LIVVIEHFIKACRRPKHKFYSLIDIRQIRQWIAVEVDCAAIIDAAALTGQG